MTRLFHWSKTPSGMLSSHLIFTNLNARLACYSGFCCLDFGCVVQIYEFVFWNFDWLVGAVVRDLESFLKKNLNLIRL